MKKILVVDDEQRICDVLKQGLEKMGDFEVTTANNGKDGMVIAKQLKPDLILLDIRMPGIDGLDTLKKLKEDADTLSIPVIMLTAVQDEEAKEKCASNYVDLYIEKPVDLMFVKQKIEDALRTRGEM